MAIIIPATNLWASYTKPCLDSIKTKHEYRVLFVDNASTDETSVEASKLVSDTFAHQRNEERWCCAKGWNFGVRDAFERGFDYVLILNNDVLLHPEAIDRLVDRFEKSKETYVTVKREDIGSEFLKAGGFVPHVTETVKESDVLAMVTLMDVRGECANPEDIFTKDVKEKEGVEEAEHPCFSGFMISKEGWDKVGPFDEEFKPCYFEDNDYHYRINLAGMKAIVLPTAMFYHYGSKTQLEALPGEVICPGPMFENNRAYYIRKWGGQPGMERFNVAFNGKEL